MKYLKTLILLFVITLGLNSCKKQKTEGLYPGVSLYKTNNDYFDKVTVGINEKGEIYRTSIAREKVYITETDTIPKYRTKLINDFVLEGEADYIHDAFLSMSYKELLLWQEKYGVTAGFSDTAWKYMLDKDPYTEFYIAKDNEMFFYPTDTSFLDTTGLKKIIQEGKIEEYFTKIK